MAEGDLMITDNVTRRGSLVEEGPPVSPCWLLVAICLPVFILDMLYFVCLVLQHDCWWRTRPGLQAVTAVL